MRPNSRRPFHTLIFSAVCLVGCIGVLVLVEPDVTPVATLAWVFAFMLGAASLLALLVALLDDLEGS